MKNIHVLPTDKPSSLYFVDNNLELIFLKGYFVHKTFQIKPQHIYITSDEEIKEDYVIAYGVVIKVMMFDKETLYFVNGTKAKREDCKKIILTTDQDLIKDGVQAIDDEFLEWFVNNPSCEEVTIRKKSVVKAIVKGIGIKSFNSGYKIIIPKSELASKLKQILDNMSQGEFDEEWKKITDLKLEGPSIIIPKEEPKQETLEEVAERFIKKQNFNSLEIDDKIFEAILFGAEWQQEQDKNKYSEEEVVSFIHKFIKEHQPQLPYLIGGINMWFEQFKKK